MEEETMKKIDFEAHFVTKEYVETMIGNKGYPRYGEDPKTKKRRLCYTPDVAEPLGDPLLHKILDHGEGRLKAMDAVGIDVQVLSLTSPGVEQFDPAMGTPLAKRTNDYLAGWVDKFPDRFVGYAALAPNDPQAAARELERAVKTLGFKGWKTHSNYGGTYIDEKKYWPILETAEKLDVPIFLHPAVPAISQLRTYGFALGGAPFGFGVETAITMMRLVHSGVFDQYPGLKIILGHLGEGLPFLLKRMDFPFDRPWVDPEARGIIKKRPSEYFRQNVFMTTSGNYLEAAFMCTYHTMGIGRMLLSTDYPYEDSDECMKFLESLPLSKEDRERLYFGNAAQLGVSI
jgi:predicted TIM-barrel fold metal-dependent hydrolase